MPMYTGGQVLDLETAVKDGILGGDGGGVICSDVTTPILVKLDLKKMIEQLDSIEENRCRIRSPFAPDRSHCNGGVSFISSLLGPFTSHLVGSEAIAILVNLELNFDCIANLLQPNKISLMVDGSTETKINCVRLMETLFNGSKTVPSLSLLVGVLRLVKDRRHPPGVLAGLRLLKIISSQQSLGNSVISIGGVQHSVEMLPQFNSECLELSLYVLESQQGNVFY
ncbi:hypothetical protein Hanom_Chr01g00067791 [Helianthus anomalus]